MFSVCDSTVILHPSDADVPAGNLVSTRLSNMLITEQRPRPKQKCLLPRLDQGLRTPSESILPHPRIVLPSSGVTQLVADMGHFPRGIAEPWALQWCLPSFMFDKIHVIICFSHVFKRL